MAADPYFPLFRSLRDAILRERAPWAFEACFDSSLPLQDYYFTNQRIRIMDAIQAADLNVAFAQSEADELLDAVHARCRRESPDLIGRTKGLFAETYKQILDNALEIIAGARDGGECKWVGFKEVWIIEFFAALARSFPDARFLVIQRDPRAIEASIQKIGEQDPSQAGHTLSYARHWRKYIAFTLHYLANPLLADRLHVVVYEKLVSEPEKTVRALCEFLEIEYDPGMLDARRYHDYSTGAVWKGNSSFEGTLRGIAPELAERWRANLPANITATVDFLCGPDMKLVGYQPLTAADGCWPKSTVLDYLIKNNLEQCSWRSDFGDPQSDYGFELFRRAVLELPNRPADTMLVRRCFLFEEVYERLQKQPLN